MAKYEILLQAIGQRFEVEENELILDAAIRQGIDIPYSCRNGTCRTCIHQVVSGVVVQEDAEVCMISAAELENNRRLLCMSTLKTDAVVAKVPPRRRVQAGNA